MAGVNKVTLIGNLGADPEVRHLESGSVVAKLRLAVTESYKNREGERVDTTEWFTLEMWEGLAKIAEQYLQKGSQIYCEGSLKTQTYDSEGVERKAVKVRVRNLTMLGRANSQASPAQQGASVAKGNDEDELPF